MNDFNTFVGKLQTQILDPIITVVALAAFILFAYGIFVSIRNADNQEARAKGQTHIIWGLIGLTIMFGAKTIVSLMQRIVAG